VFTLWQGNDRSARGSICIVYLLLLLLLLLFLLSAANRNVFLYLHAAVFYIVYMRTEYYLYPIVIIQTMGFNPIKVSRKLVICHINALKKKRRPINHNSYKHNIVLLKKDLQ